MPKKNIAPGTNHIKVPLPKGEPKPLVLLPVRAFDYEGLEKLSKKWGVDLDMVVHNLLVPHAREIEDE